MSIVRLPLRKVTLRERTGASVFGAEWSLSVRLSFDFGSEAREPLAESAAGIRLTTCSSALRDGSDGELGGRDVATVLFISMDCGSTISLTSSFGGNRSWPPINMPRSAAA